MISSEILRDSLRRTLLFMDKDKSMTILSLLLLRTRLKRSEILTQCMEVIGASSLCEELPIYVDKNKKYFNDYNGIIALKDEIAIYSNIVYDILQDLDVFVLNVSEGRISANDIASRSLTPSALLLAISSNPSDIGCFDLIIYYFVTMLLAQLFLLLSEAYPYFRELVSIIENGFPAQKQ